MSKRMHLDRLDFTGVENKANMQMSCELIAERPDPVLPSIEWEPFSQRYLECKDTPNKRQFERPPNRALCTQLCGPGYD